MACDRLLTDRPVDLTQHNMSLEMDYSGLTGDPFPQCDDDWLPEAAGEDGEPLSRADIDRIGDQHRPACYCDECRAGRAA